MEKVTYNQQKQDGEFYAYNLIYKTYKNIGENVHKY